MNQNTDLELKKRKSRNDRLVRTYGITLDQYEILLQESNGRCGICGNKPRKYPLNVDHEHSTGIIRGLLCMRCNRGLGLLGDSLERIDKARLYLERFEEMRFVNECKWSLKVEGK